MMYCIEIDQVVVVAVVRRLVVARSRTMMVQIYHAVVVAVRQVSLWSHPDNWMRRRHHSYNHGHNHNHHH